MKMKYRILYLVPDIIGPPSGIGRYCQLVCQTLLAAEWPSTVVALTDHAAATTIAHTQFPDVRYFPCGGSRHYFVYKALQQTLHIRPDLILIGHVNFAPLGDWLARLVGARTATFIYGIDVMAPLPGWRRRALQHSHQIISISRFTAQQAAQMNGIDTRKVKILHNCLDPQFAMTQPITRQMKTPSILTVARMSLAEQYKGHDYVIKAMPTLLQRFPELVYNIVGDGDGRPVLEALTAEVGVTQAVHFHGRVSDQELQQFYAEATLFIMPSRAEGFGFVFLEAMAHGVPVIGGNLDATPEVIVDRETGFLIDPRSVDAVVDSADRLLRDQSLRQRMSVAAIQHVAHNFSFDLFQKQLLSYLQ